MIELKYHFNFPLWWTAFVTQFLVSALKLCEEFNRYLASKYLLDIYILYLGVPKMATVGTLHRLLKLCMDRAVE